MPARAHVHVGMTWLLSSLNAGTPILHWVGCAGPGRHGGEAPALWGGPMMSALILSPFLIKKKGQIKDPMEAALIFRFLFIRKRKEVVQ